MRAHQVDLQLANLVTGNPDIAQLADAGCDGVGNLFFRHQRIHHVACGVNAFASIRREQHGPAFDCDLPHGFGGQIISGNVKRVQEQLSVVTLR
jgi:hypothetical protein